MNVLVRPSGARDVPAIDALCNSLYKKEPGASKLLDTALLCLTAISEDGETVLGFLCLHDGPTIRFGSTYDMEQLDWLKDTPGAQINTCSSAYIWVCAVAPQVEMKASVALLRGALSALPLISKLKIALRSGTSVPERGLASLLTPMAISRGAPVTLYELTREELLPSLVMRAARVEDHDDMLPVLTRAEARFPALAKLPESSRPQEAFALTRVVSDQDESNVVMIAQETHSPPGGGAPRGLVGFMVLTSEVDVSALTEAFDLHPYDNLLPSELYESQMEQAREAARTKKRNTLEAKLGSRAVMRASSLDQGPEGDGGNAEGQQQGEEGTEGEELGADEPIDITAASEPTEDEVRHEAAHMFDASEAVPSVFAITMACIDRDYDAHSVEFLKQAFESFPDKMYCLLTLPHDSPEPPLVAHFTRLVPLPGNNFPEVLYLFHRHALMDGFDVRLALPRDADGVSLLISGMPNSSDIKEIFGSALERNTAVVAVAGGEVVGLVTISEKVDVQLLEANFSLSNLLYLPHHPPEMHGEIDMVCINPIFSHHARTVLSGAQRLLKKTVLYYALPPAQPPPDVLDIMMQVPPRHRAPAVEGDEAEFALYLLSRRHAFIPRQAVNAQLIVVGASDTGLAAVERLLMDRDLSFNYVTLLAPGGLSLASTGSQYTSGIIAKLGLDTRVTLVDAEMVGLDTQTRMIELSDGSHLVYDLLIITSGLQEQTCNNLAEHDPEIAGVVLNAAELASAFTLADGAALNHIMVYGQTLDAYHALATLEDKGASDKTTFYAPWPGEVSPLVSCMLTCAESMGVALPTPTAMNLFSLSKEEMARHMTAIVMAPDSVAKEEVEVDLVVGCTPVQASKTIFMCLNNAGVVYDGRVVVDNCFCTSDPQIYAAGTVAKLSRRYGRNINFEQYSSREVGTALGASIVAAFQAQPQTDQPPSLGQQAARSISCQLPGGFAFMFTGSPLAMAQPSLTPPPGGRAMTTTSERGNMHVLLDASGCVHSIVYLGRLLGHLGRLSSLVGLHSNYLNGLVDKFDKGEVQCLINHLTIDPWVELLYHEQFASLRQSQILSSLELVASVPKTATGDLLAAAQGGLLEFVRAHVTELPGFAAPTPA